VTINGIANGRHASHEELVMACCAARYFTPFCCGHPDIAHHPDPPEEIYNLAAWSRTSPDDGSAQQKRSSCHAFA